MPSIDRRDAAPVLRVGRIIGMRDLGTLLAVADRRDARRRYAMRDQHVFHGLGTALAQRQIVFAGAALVAMALDRDRDIRITPQPFGLALQRLLPLRGNIGLVIGEKHAIAGGRGEILLRSRSETRAADTAGPPWPARPRRGFGRVAAGGQQRERARESDKTSKHR